MNYWPHLSMQKISRIHLSITNPNYSFFIEDGYNFPSLNSRSTKYSVLHDINIIKKRSRDGCVNYNNGKLKRKDDFIQNCTIEKAKTKDGSIPTDVNLIMDGRSNYSDLKFSN